MSSSTLPSAECDKEFLSSVVPGGDPMDLSDALRKLPPAFLKEVFNAHRFELTALQRALIPVMFAVRVRLSIAPSADVWPSVASKIRSAVERCLVAAQSSSWRRIEVREPVLDEVQDETWAIVTVCMPGGASPASVGQPLNTSLMSTSSPLVAAGCAKNSEVETIQEDKGPDRSTGGASNVASNTKLQSEAALAYVDDCITERESFQSVVMEELYSLCLANYDNFVTGMTRIQSVSRGLDETGVEASTGLFRIRRAREGMCHNALRVLARARRLERLGRVATDLEAMRRVADLEDRVRSLFAASDVAGAIGLLGIAREMALPLCERYAAMRALVDRWEIEYAAQLEARTNAALEETVSRFTPTAFLSALTAYNLLGRVSHVPVRLAKLFRYAAEKQSLATVQQFALTALGHEGVDVTAVFNSGVGEVATMVASVDMLKCVLQLYAVLSGILFNYVTMCRVLAAARTQAASDAAKRVNTHQSGRTDTAATSSGAGSVQMLSAAAKAIPPHGRVSDGVWDYQAIEDGLIAGKEVLWTTISASVGAVLGAASFGETTNVDTFLEAFHASQLFLSMGQEFLGRDASPATEAASPRVIHPVSTKTSASVEKALPSVITKKSHSEKNTLSAFAHAFRDKVDKFTDALDIMQDSSKDVDSASGRYSVTLGAGASSRSAVEAMVNPPPAPTSADGILSLAVQQYVRLWHSSQMEMIRAGISHESWAPIPSSVASVTDFTEFDFVADVPSKQKGSAQIASADVYAKDVACIQLFLSGNKAVTTSHNPFARAAEIGAFPVVGPNDVFLALREILAKHSVAALPTILSRASADELDSVAGFSTDPNTPRSGPVFSAASHRLTKLLATVCRIMRLFHHHIPDPIHLIAAPIATYIHAVLCLFGAPRAHSSKSVYDPQADDELPLAVRDGIRVLRRMGGCADHAASHLEYLTLQDEELRGLLSSTSTIHGIALRTTAVHSLDFLVDVSEAILAPNALACLLLPEQRTSVLALRDAIISSIDRVHAIIYQRLVNGLLNVDAVGEALSSVKYEVGDTDMTITKPCRDISSSITILGTQLLALADSNALCRPLSYVGAHGKIRPAKNVVHEFWKHATAVIFGMLVESWSRAKRATTAGRALMKLDLRHLQVVLDEVTQGKVSHDRDYQYAEQYLHAFYISDAPKLLQWIKDVRAGGMVYSLRQVKALVDLGLLRETLKKKEREDLLKSAEALLMSGAESNQTNQSIIILR